MTSSPPSPLALFQEALRLHQAGDPARARDLYVQVIMQEPTNAEALRLLGIAECQLGRLEAGELMLRRSLELNPHQSGAHYNRGNALHGLNRFEEALTSYDAALALNPASAGAHYGKGFPLLDLGRFADAVASYDRALALRPDFADAWLNRGNALRRVERPDDAMASYRRALSIEPDNAEAHNNLGHALYDAGDFATAVDHYDRALTIRLDYPWLEGQVLHARMQIADWRDFGGRRDRLAAKITRGEAAAAPFQVQSLIDDPHLQRFAAETYAAAMFPARPALAQGPATAHDRIRIGYVSSDFRDHPVAHLIAATLEHHDRTKFEVLAFSLGGKSSGKSGEDAWRDRIAHAVDRFVDLSAMSDDQAAQAIRDLGVDIVIDLNGFTKGNRTGIFAARPAPVQVGYLGYLGTMGTPYFDYIVADDALIPADAASAFSEKIIRLPSYQSNDDRPIDTAPTPSRAEIGLPERGFVFCAFNQTYKINPTVFESWMCILTATPGSVLWLLAETDAARHNLRAEAQALGIDADRIVFAGRVPLGDHVARLKLADLFLDTHPYTAGSSASNALRASLPVLSLVGGSLAARMGGSLLHAAGVPELAVSSVQDYEALAIRLASDAQAMAGLRHRLAEALPHCALFDTPRFVRTLEAAYAEVHDRRRRGLASDDIRVD